jgi:hypothetical protein
VRSLVCAISAFAILAACKSTEPGGDPLLASTAKPCVDPKTRVQAKATWEQTAEGLALRTHVEARAEAKDVRIDSEPSVSGNGQLIARKVSPHEVIVDVIVSPMTGHVEILLPNQLCDGGQESGSIRVVSTWRGAPSLHPPIETKLASTGRRGT